MPLRNRDYTDRELLHIIRDVAANDGYATTVEIAERLGIPLRQTASRMAWMANFNFCARHPKESGVYRITPQGKTLMEGALTPEAEQFLGGMQAGDRLLVLRAVARPTFYSGGQTAQTILRREFQHHLDNRRTR